MHHQTAKAATALMISILAISLLTTPSLAQAKTVDDPKLGKELLRLATEFLVAIGDCRLDDAVSYLDINHFASVWGVNRSEAVRSLKESFSEMCDAEAVVGKLRRVDIESDGTYVMRAYDPHENVNVKVKFKRHEGEHLVTYKIVDSSIE